MKIIFKIFIITTVFVIIQESKLYPGGEGKRAFPATRQDGDRTLRRMMTQSGSRELKCVLIELGSSELLNQTFTFYFTSDEFKSGIVACTDASCCTAFTIRYVKKSLMIVLLKITSPFT